MANETILIVDADTKSQKVLEVSFKKAGYRVVMTDGPARARELVQDVSPDIIISDTQFQNGGNGFDFLADVKTGPFKVVPFIFLTEERALPQKMKGFELGADDYLTKPIYIKEVTTRVELLLQKRAKEQLTEDDVEELEGNVADITMIDLLQTIEEELRSGTIHLTREQQSAVIYFREGNILDAICGKLQGEEAIYRLMLWPDGEFVLRYHDQVRRVDRIEKDSGALLLEGIRRLDRYSELVEGLPPLHRVFEADYQALSGILDQLPPEVARILRLFDGLRSIREVTDGSPVDDVTTLKIVTKLIGDGFLTDITPSARRAERPSRSNLAAWLDGVRSDEDGPSQHLDREDTSPKFGSSIAEMAEKRSTEQTEAARDTVESAQPPAGRDPRDTDPFGSRSQAREGSSRRRTAPMADAIPLKDAFDTIDAWESEQGEGEPRRQTALQWDRPRSDWNIHFDAADDSTAAIREIEEEERRRRNEEARHISDVKREGTLRFAPAQSRDSQGDVNEDVLRQIEEDERRRRTEEARQLQAQRADLDPEGDPPEADEPKTRRNTDELPQQPRVPSAPDVDADPDADVDVAGNTNELYAEDPQARPTTPLSSPALQRFDGTPVPAPEIDEGWDALAASDVIDDAATDSPDSVSEQDVFDDDSDELERDPPPPPEAPANTPRSERVTLDIRPPTDTQTEEEDDVDPGGLFDQLGNEDTAPGGDEMESLEIEVIEVLPTVERQATDQQIVNATFDLSLRKTISPNEIEGRPEAIAERETVELRAVGFESDASAETDFFSGGASEDYEYEDPAGGGSAGLWIAGALAAAVLAVGYFGFIATDEPEPVENITPDPPQTIAQNTTAPLPPETIPPEPTEPPGLTAEEAFAWATGYGMEVGGAANQLTLVMSGADLLPDMGQDTPDAGETTETPPIAVNVPPKEKPPITEKPPIKEKPPVADKPPVKEKPPVITKADSAAVRKAERLVKQEKYDAALGMLRQLSKADPKDKKIAYLHGYAAFSSNKTSEAITHLARAERLGYRTGPLYLDLAAAYQLDGKKSRAKWAYEKFLTLQPNGRQADEVRTILSTHF